MKKTITLPASVQEYFVIEDNQISQWYRIPATEWQPGLPPAVLVPVSLPLIEKISVTKKQISITFVFRTKEEKEAWKHTKTYIHEVFGVEEQPKRFSFFGAAAIGIAALAIAAVGISANAEKAVEVCTKQATSLGMNVKNAYGANLCEWGMYRRSVQKEYDKLSK